MLHATNVVAQPIVNFFELHTQETHRLEFIELGKQNIQGSFHNEKGTLTMLAVSLPDKQNYHYVFEIYQDNNSYQQHRNSLYFQHFLDLSQKMLWKKLALPVEIIFSLEKQALSPKEMNKFYFFMGQQEISNDKKTESIQYIQDWIKQHTETSAVYVMSNKKQPSQWIIIVINSQNIKPNLPFQWQKIQNMSSFIRGTFRSS